MRKLIIFLFVLIIQGRIWGQEFLIANHFTVIISSNPHTSEVYFKDYYSFNDYYLVNLHDMVLKPSQYQCVPIFSYNTNKMVYRDSINLYLIDFDRNKTKIIHILDSLNYLESSEMFSPNGENVILGHYYYSFKDSSLKPFNYVKMGTWLKWSSDTTLISPVETPTGKSLVEYSITKTKTDTIYVFDKTLDGFIAWNYDTKRNKLYYSTETGQQGPIANLWVYNRETKIDSILFEYPKDYTCPNLPGVVINNILFSGNYEKMEFALSYLTLSSTDILMYWPDSNKITSVTVPCTHYGQKDGFAWANEDTLVFTDLTQGPLFGISVPNITGIEKEEIPVIQNGYSLSQNYPNPFNPSTVISYSLTTASKVKLIVYNTLGQIIKVLENGFKIAGNYSISFSASDLPSGIYFYKLEAGQFSQVKKMILMK